LSEADIRQAAEAGRRWKLVCSAVRQGDGVDARVSPELLEASDPLFHVMGTSAAVTFESDVLGPLTVREGDPGPRTTAYGMFADLLNCLVPGPSTG
jgi:homoserine dehydrogenase